MWARLVARVRTGDPDGTYWRRGLRLAVVLPPLLAAFLAADAPTAAGFAVFSAVGALGLSDFGGSTRRRLQGYAGLLLVGSAYVALGTLCSRHLAAAVAGMFVVAFVTRMVGIFGGGAATGNASLLLAFVLAVMTPAGPDELGARELGWVIGGVVATVCAFTLWPRPHQDRLGTRASAAVCAVARAVRAAQRPGSSASVDDEVDLVRAARRCLAETPAHPSGPNRRDQLLLQTVELVERAVPLLGLERPDPLLAAVDSALADGTAEAYDAYGQALVDGAGADPLERARHVDEVRQRHREAVEAWVRAQLGPVEGEGDGDGDGEVVAAPAASGAALAADEPVGPAAPQPARPGAAAVVHAVRGSFPLRVLSAIVEQLWLTAAWADGRPLPADTDTGLDPGPEGRGWWARAQTIIWSHLDTGSAWFQSSLRAAVALAASVAVGQLLGVQHAFWVVLGTLSVLRSNASGTRASAAQAVLGTVIGFALVTLVLLGPGREEAVLWVLLAVFSFVGMWGAGVFGLVVGQAGFALIVVVLYNLIDPVGWETGLDRVETVAVGVGVSVVAAALFWPRGARAVLRRDVALAYRAASRYLDEVVHRIGQPDDGVDLHPYRVDAVRAQRRAMEAFEEYLVERGTKPESWTTWGPLLRGPSAVVFGSGLVARRIHCGTHPTPEHSVVAAALAARGRAVHTALLDVAAALEARRPVAAPAALEVDPPADADVVALLHAAAQDPERFDRALSLIWVDEWLAYLARAVERVDEAVAAVAAASGDPEALATSGGPDAADDPPEPTALDR